MGVESAGRRKEKEASLQSSRVRLRRPRSGAMQRRAEGVGNNMDVRGT